MAGPSYIHLEKLNEITGGDPAFTLALLTKMQVNIPIALENMEKALFAEQWPDLKAAAHKVKSTFAYLDIQEMRDKLQDIEHCAMEGRRLDELPDMVQHAIAQGREILLELEVVIQQLKN